MTERVTGTYEAISMMRASKAAKPGTILYFDHPKGKSRQELKSSDAKANSSASNLIVRCWKCWTNTAKFLCLPTFSMPLKNLMKAVTRRFMPNIPEQLLAPTAGLHFTDELLQQIRDKGCEEVFVTLHVGAGTFQPVRVENLSEHIMHSEWYSISPEATEKINKAKAERRRVVCVGTTSLRTG